MARKRRKKHRRARAPATFVGNRPAGPLLDVLTEALERCTSAYLAVAYVSTAGWQEIAPGVKSVLDRGGSVQITTDLAACVTEPDAVDAMAAVGPGVARGFFHPGGSGRSAEHYHPKAYGFLFEDSALLVVGSSNLTEGGLARNVESCLVVRVPPTSQVWQSFGKWFRDLWGDEALVHPLTPAVLRAYRECSARGRQLSKPEQIEETTALALAAALVGQEEATAFLAGLIVGHGRVDRRRRALTCTFTHRSAEDPEALLAGVKEVAEYLTGAFGGASDGITTEVISPSDQQAGLRLRWARGSPTFARLSRSGLEEAAIPDWVQDADDSTILAFLRGVGETASIVARGSRDWVGRHRIKICSGDRDPVLLRSIQGVLRERFDIRTSLNRRPRDDPREHQLNVYVEDYETIGFASDWKTKRLKEFIQANRERAEASQ